MTNDNKKLIKIAAVGDIMLGDLPACYGFGVGSVIQRESVDFPFKRVTDHLKKSDIVFGNLEVILSDRGRNPFWLPTLYLRGMPKAGEALKNAGFDVLNVANNHLMQHGGDCFLDTLKVLKNVGLDSIGVANEENGYHSIPCIKEVKEIKIGFLGYSLRPEEYSLTGTRYAMGTRESILADLKKLKKEVDIVVISLHWGDEFIQKPSRKQIELGKEIIDEGAHIILGHHPHVLQGIQRYAHGLIAYSLGNFVFDQWLPSTRDSMILEVDLHKNGIENHKVTPARLNRFYQPGVLEGQEFNELSAELTRLSNHIEECNYSEEEYQAELAINFNAYRKSTKGHYKKNLMNYRMFYLLELIALIGIRRIFKKHI